MENLDTAIRLTAAMILRFTQDFALLNLRSNSVTKLHYYSLTLYL
jgi:hypothetical protein